MTAATRWGKNANMTDCKHVQEHLTKRIIEGSPEDEKGRYKTYPTKHDWLRKFCRSKKHPRIKYKILFSF
jgi:hypothetical protein